MSWITLTAPIFNSMVVYNNSEDKQPYLQHTRSFTNDTMQESTLHLPLHTGTHVDYPRHAIANGKTSSDYELFPIELQGLVLDLSDQNISSIIPQHLQNISLNELDFLFFKTHQDPLKTFNFDFPYLTQEAAALLTHSTLKFVGTDHAGIERNQPHHETHTLLLSHDILIIEDLALHHIKGGVLSIVLATLGLKDADAEPIFVMANI